MLAALIVRAVEATAASPAWSGRVQLAPGFAVDAARSVVAVMHDPDASAKRLGHSEARVVPGGHELARVLRGLE